MFHVTFHAQKIQDRAQFPAEFPKLQEIAPYTIPPSGCYMYLKFDIPGRAKKSGNFTSFAVL